MKLGMNMLLWSTDVSGSKFMIVDNVVNSGREPSGDERAFRFGLRLGF